MSSRKRKQIVKSWASCPFICLFASKEKTCFCRWFGPNTDWGKKIIQIHVDSAENFWPNCIYVFALGTTYFHVLGGSAPDLLPFSSCSAPIPLPIWPRSPSYPLPIPSWPPPNPLPIPSRSSLDPLPIPSQFPPDPLPIPSQSPPNPLPILR